jgi:hypothetical protein
VNRVILKYFKKNTYGGSRIPKNKPGNFEYSKLHMKCTFIFLHLIYAHDLQITIYLDGCFKAVVNLCSSICTCFKTMKCIAT